MTGRVQKIAALCIFGALTITGKSVFAKAAADPQAIGPVAGIDLLLNEINLEDKDTSKDILIQIKSELSDYSDTAVAQVTNYVNIRKKASEDSKVVGKLYNNSAATVLSTKNGWSKIKSGTVTGYIKSDFLVTGYKVDKLAEKVGTRLAEVNTTTLNVREKADKSSDIITLVPIGETLKVLKENEDWVKVKTDDMVGFVSADYVDLTTKFDQAISIEEEKEKLAKEAAQENNSSVSSNNTSSGNTSSGNTSSGNTSSGNTSSDNSSSSSSSSTGTYSSLRQRIVNYALRFIGNPYVWGGTSLTGGTDCSGFTQSVFGDFGIYIPRTSREQAYSGSYVSLSSLRPGDLVFYTKYGTINHVAMYIGNGEVISASSPSTGIRVTSLYYRTPYSAVSYIN